MKFSLPVDRHVSSYLPTKDFVQFRMSCVFCTKKLVVASETWWIKKSEKIAWIVVAMVYEIDAPRFRQIVEIVNW